MYCVLPFEPVLTCTNFTIDTNGVICMIIVFSTHDINDVILFNFMDIW